MASWDHSTAIKELGNKELPLIYISYLGFLQVTRSLPVVEYTIALT